MQDVFYDDYAEGDSPKGFRRWVALYVKWGGAALSLAVLVLIVVWAYRLGVRDAREVPVIRAMDLPARVQPEDPGGTEMAHQGLEVNRILGGGAAQAPEETRRAPGAVGLRPEDTPAVTEAVTEIEQAAAERTAPEPEAAAPAEQEPEIGAVIEQLLAESFEEGEGDSPSAALAPAVPDEEAVAALRPRTRPESLARPVTPLSEAEPQPVASAARTGAGIDPDAMPAGTRLIQLGAFDSPEIAQGQWVRLLEGHADLLGNRQHYVQRAESNGTIFYRLRVMGFEDSNAQRAICEALRARSVDCIPVTVR